MKFIAYLFYLYYSKGPRKTIAYLSTILAMCLLFYIHLFQALILLASTNIIPSGSKFEASTWVKLALFMLPIFFFFRWLLPEPDLKEASYDEGIIRKGNVRLVVYIIFSITLLVFLILYKKGKL